MNLDELANYVCGKVNQSQTEDIAACKTYLTARQKLIWNEALWKDSLVEYVQTVSMDPDDYTVTSVWLPTKAVLLLPTIIDRVLAVRTDTRHLNIQRPEFYYRHDFDSFGQNGTSTDFILLSPCVWEVDVLSAIILVRSDLDLTSSLTEDVLEDDNTSVERLTTDLTTNYTEVDTTERIDAVIKQTTEQSVEVHAGPETITIAGAGTAAANGTIERNGTWNGKPYYGSILGQSQPVFTPTDPGPSVGYDGSNWRIFGKQDANFYSSLYFDSTATPWAFPGEATYSNSNGIAPVPTLTSAGAVITITATTTSQPKRQRIKLVQGPIANTADFTLRVLGKRSCPSFTDDLDEPAINGSENLLIALAHADMLERTRQYGKAAAIKQEAATLLTQLKMIETAQQAHNVQLRPEYGYGNEWATGEFSSPLSF